MYNLITKKQVKLFDKIMLYVLGELRINYFIKKLKKCLTMFFILLYLAHTKQTYYLI